MSLLWDYGKTSGSKRLMDKLTCHGCQKSAKLFLHVMDDSFIYALCRKCVIVQLDIEHYMRKNNQL